MSINNIIHQLDFVVAPNTGTATASVAIFRFDTTIESFDSTQFTFDEN